MRQGSIHLVLSSPISHCTPNPFSISPFLLGLSLSSLSLPPLPSSEHQSVLSLRFSPSPSPPFLLSDLHLPKSSLPCTSRSFFSQIFIYGFLTLVRLFFFVMSHCRNVPLSFSNGGPHYPLLGSSSSFSIPYFLLSIFGQSMTAVLSSAQSFIWTTPLSSFVTNPFQGYLTEIDVPNIRRAIISS